MIKRTALFLMATLALTALAACSGSSGSTEALNITIQAEDIKFDTTTITARVGQTVNVTYQNVGALEHNFLIDEFGVEEKVQPGQTITFSFTPTSAGTYQYYCNVPGHIEAGMVGTLTVNP
jgi:plastocyanin